MCVLLPASGSFHVADAFQPVPSLTVSHVCSGRKCSEPVRFDIILVHVSLTKIHTLCEYMGACRALSLCWVMIERVDERQWKRSGGGGGGGGGSWLMIFHLG